LLNNLLAIPCYLTKLNQQILSDIAALAALGGLISADKYLAI